MSQSASDAVRRSEPGLRARLAAVLLLAGLLTAGCGASSSHPTTAAAFHFPKPATVPAAVRAQEQAIHRQVLADLHAPVPKGLKPGAARFIPHSAVAVNRTVTATAAHPQLAIAGDSVVLDLASGHALATMTGPTVNVRYQDGGGTEERATPAQFELTLQDAHGTVPLAADDFTIEDELSASIVPVTHVEGGRALPAQLAPGQRLTLIMTASIPEGGGVLEYSPTGIVKPGNPPLAGWDFSVENDD